MAIRKDIGYLLPEVIDPEAAVCIRVYVPDAAEYIAAFWGSYEFLTAWIAWEKDDDHRGKDAAAVWKPYFEQAREEYLCSGGVCGMVDVRQKPGVPCVLQKLDTCGGTWVDFADLRFCAFGIDDMLYGEGDSWKEIDDILWQLKSWIEQIDVWLTAGKDGAEIKFLMSQQISWMKGLDVIIDNMEEMSEGERGTAIEALDWDDIRASVYCDGEECHVDYGTLDTYYDWLNCVAEWTFDTLNNLSNDLFDALDETYDWIIDALNLAPIARQGGGGGFGGVEPDCTETWEKTYDFTLSDGGFERWSSYNIGVWVNGSGWRQELYSNATDRIRGALLQKQWSNSPNVTSVTVAYTITKGVFSPAISQALYLGIDSVQLISVSSDDIVDGAQEQSAICDVTDDQTFLMWQCGYRNDSVDPGGELYITSVTYEGIGAGPVD